MKTVFPFYLIGSCVLENKKHIVHSSYACIVSKLGFWKQEERKRRGYYHYNTNDKHFTGNI